VNVYAVCVGVCPCVCVKEENEFGFMKHDRKIVMFITFVCTEDYCDSFDGCLTNDRCDYGECVHDRKDCDDYDNCTDDVYMI